MKLELIIGELLMRNNCVVIPHFGGFIAAHCEAQIDYSKGIISPPKKSILFNKQLTNSDGLLFSAYATNNKIDFNTAAIEVQNQIKLWQEELNAGNRITFDKVGFLYFDNQKNIHFEQDRFFNLLMQSFGMGQISFIADDKAQVNNVIALANPSNQDFSIEKKPFSLHESEQIETPIIQLLPNFTKKQELKSEKLKTSFKPNSNKKLIKYIAAACILPIAFYSIWIPTKTNVLESGMISSSDFNPFHKKEISSYTSKLFKTKLAKFPIEISLKQQVSSLPAEVNVYSMEVDDEVFFVKLKDSFPTEKSDLLIQNESEISASKVFDKQINSEGKFQLIVGSFSNQNNATDLVNSLISKGFSAYKFEQVNGLIRVSAGRATTQSAAQELVEKLSVLDVAAWILR